TGALRAEGLRSLRNGIRQRAQRQSRSSHQERRATDRKVPRRELAAHARTVALHHLERFAVVLECRLELTESLLRSRQRVNGRRHLRSALIEDLLVRINDALPVLFGGTVLASGLQRVRVVR